MVITEAGSESRRTIAQVIASAVDDRVGLLGRAPAGRPGEDHPHVGEQRRVAVDVLFAEPAKTTCGRI
jgi:hypothetical protein